MIITILKCVNGSANYGFFCADNNFARQLPVDNVCVCVCYV